MTARELRYCIYCDRDGYRGFRDTGDGFACKAAVACDRRRRILEGPERPLIDPNQHVAPITATDPMKRLDALIRRHGGVVKPSVDPTKMVLPPVKRAPIKDQMALDL